MIVGIGIDIVTTSRIADAIKDFNTRFITRCFTQAEINKCQQAQNEELRISHFAARFAAKEATMKAMGTGLRGFKFTDIEVINDEKGKPSIQLHNNAKMIAKKLKINKIHVSITHENDRAVAFVIAETID